MIKQIVSFNKTQKKKLFELKFKINSKYKQNNVVFHNGYIWIS